MAENLAIFLATRQKRLSYWREVFNSTSLSEAKAKELHNMLNTYQLLLAKLAKAESAESVAEERDRVLSLETELTSLFELGRQFTSKFRGHASTPVHKPREKVESGDHS